MVSKHPIVSSDSSDTIVVDGANEPSQPDGCPIAPIASIVTIWTWLTVV